MPTVFPPSAGLLGWSSARRFAVAAAAVVLLWAAVGWAFFFEPPVAFSAPAVESR